MRPCVSVIIPMYKGQKYIYGITKMMESIQRKSQNVILEVILVNDYPEEQISLLSSSEIQVKLLVNEENRGIHQSRVNGLNASNGEYIVFLDQDDNLDADFIKEMSTNIQGYDAVFCDGVWRNSEKILSNPKIKKMKYTLDEYESYGYPLVSTGQMMIKKSKIPELWTTNIMNKNGWDDHLLWILMLVNNLKIKMVDKELYTHVENGNNESFNWEGMACSGENFIEIIKKLDFMDDDVRDIIINKANLKIAKYKKYDELEKRMLVTSPKAIIEKLTSRGVSKIAIYGYGVYGRRLYNIIKDSTVSVCYAIDRNSKNKNDEIPIFDSIKDSIFIDAIIVTPVFEYDEIASSLNKETKKDIISLLDIL